MDKAVSVSVLTPVYNVEKYLRQCLDSLCSQTLDSIEFIVINDGSTDGSLGILEEYAMRDKRFVLIDKPNTGYGCSMNMGMRRARGEYIGIVEPDDYADSDMFRSLYEAAHENNCDIVKSNRYDLSKNGDHFNEMLAGLPYDTVFTPADIPEVFDPAPAIWAGIYRRTFLEENGISFLETPGASFQDAGFAYKSLMAANRVMLLKDAFIHYRIDNDGSSVKSASKLFCVCDEFDSIDAFISDRSIDATIFGDVMNEQRYQAYQWNYNRLNWRARREFIPRFANDFRRIRNEGRLHRGRFSAAEWDRLNRLMENHEELFENEAPLISVIVPAYNCERHLLDTFNSIEAQTLRRIEVIVVDDGSTDSTHRICDEYAASHDRFSVIHQENRGLSGARNTGLDLASGKYISFIDGEDVVPMDALEELYRRAEIKQADLTIGVIREFSPILSHEFERTVALSRKDDIDKYDTDLVWSFSVNNKLFLRKKIEDLNLRFEEGRYSEDGLFLMTYVFNSKRITGCPTVVLDYRRDFFWDGYSITHSASMKHAADLVYIHEQIIRQAESSFDRDIKSADDELTRRRLGVEQITYVQELHQRIVSYLIDLQYRRIWLMDDDAVAYMLDKINEHKVFIPVNKWEGMCKWHADLPLADGLKSKAEAACDPLVTIALRIDAGMTKGLVSEFFDSIFHNTLPLFEVIAPAAFKDYVPTFYMSQPNVHFIEWEESSSFESCALSCSHAPFIMFMHEPVFLNTSTLLDLWRGAHNSQADFVVGQIAQISDDEWVLWKTQKTVFTFKRSEGYSKQSHFNELDCSLNNKLIKTRSLITKGILFTGDAKVDSLALYEGLSFKKYPDILFITRMREKEFLGSSDFGRDFSVRIAYIADRADLDHGKRFLQPYAERVVRFEEAIERRAIPKDTIIFFTNRGYLSDNLRLVFEQLEGNKVTLTQPLPYTNRYERYVGRMLKRSKLVVLDDTCHFLESINLNRDKTKVVQLWHACGAFKKFGLHNFHVPAGLERSKHNQYALVSVSSELMKPIYSDAFGISTNVVKALGVPRTDLLLDESVKSVSRKRVYLHHPEFAGKKIVLYCPTFRQRGGYQSAWDTHIDWRKLSASLDEDVVLIVKQHPLERVDLLQGLTFANIIRCEDMSSSDMLFAASLLITDYSSIVFDASLLGVPTIFYCPDIDSYETGFYVDFPNDLNGELVTDSESLACAIHTCLQNDVSPRDAWFKEKFLGACDGHSTERIVKYINENFL